MAEFNPYEAPKSEVAPRPAHADGDWGVWRAGPLLVMLKDAELPDRCVKCNAPAEGRRLRRNLSWHPPAWYLLLLFNILIYVIVALIIRKTARIEVGLCADHRSRRRRAIAVGWISSLAGLGLIIAGAGAENGWLALFGVAALLFGLIFGIVGAQPVVPARIDDHYVWLKKVHPDYLNSIGDRDEIASRPDRINSPWLPDSV